jgi:hypothetical protein
MHADFSVELGRDDPALELPWQSDNPRIRYYDLKNHPELVLQIPEAAAHPPLSAFLGRINAAGFPLATAKCDAWHSREVTPEEEVFGDRKFVSYVDLVFEDEAARGSLAKHETFVKELCRLLARAPEIAATVEVAIRRCYYHSNSAGERAAVHENWRREARDASDLQTWERGEAVVGNVEEAPGPPGAKDSSRDEADGREQVGRERGGEREPQWEVDGARVGDAGELAETELRDRDVDDDRLLRGPDASTSGFCLTVYVSGFGDDQYEPGHRWEVALTLLQNAVVQLARNHDGRGE